MNSVDIRKRQDIVTRLLASENLNIIRHAKAEAYFDLKSRTIYKPDWDTDSIGNDPDASDLIDIHEVGHALYTPDSHKVTPLLNIVEDWRIERLLKRKFGGVAPVFARGYRKLYEHGFFSDLSKVDLNSLNLLDRINLRNKLGFMFPISFSPKEQEILDLGDKMETWDDVLHLCEVIKLQVEENGSYLPQNQNVLSSDNSSGLSETEEGDFDSFEIDYDGDGNPGDGTPDGKIDDQNPEGNTSTQNGKPTENNQNESQIKSPSKKASDGKVGGDGLNSITIDAFEEKLSGMINNTRNVTTYKLGNIKSGVTPKEIRENCIRMLRQVSSEKSGYSTQSKSYFSKMAKSIDVLVREYELKKNAAERRRDMTSSSGKLDHKKLAKYKITDNLFKKTITRFDGKSHAFVFYVDYSGSMAGSEIRSTVDQLLIMTGFCDRVNIPYMVFGYSGGGMANKKSLVSDSQVFTNTTSHMLMLDSRMSKTMKTKARDIMRMTAYVKNFYFNGDCRNYYQFFGGTPSFASLISTYDTVSQFFQECNVDKRNIVFMTDGQPGDCIVERSLKRDAIAKKIGKIQNLQVLIDEFTKKSYEFNCSIGELFAVLRIIGDRVDANVTYMHITTSKEIPKDYLCVLKDKILKNGDKYLPDSIPTGYKDNKQKYYTHFDSSQDESRLEYTTGYAKMNQAYMRGIKNDGFVRINDMETVDNMFFIKCRPMSSALDNVLENDELKDMTTKKIGTAIARASRLEGANRQLLSALADTFNYV